jgi:hypothetical protein
MRFGLLKLTSLGHHLVARIIEDVILRDAGRFVIGRLMWSLLAGCWVRCFKLEFYCGTQRSL